MVPSNRYVSWNTITSCAISVSVVRSRTSVPPTLTTPWSGSQNLAIRRGMIVLPVPEVPTRAVIVPAGISRLVDALVNVITATSGPDRDRELDLARGRVLLGTPSLAGVTRTYEVEFEILLAAWIAARTGRDPGDFDVRTTAAMFVAARRVVVAEWLNTDGAADVGELARRSLAPLRSTD